LTERQRSDIITTMQRKRKIPQNTANIAKGYVGGLRKEGLKIEKANELDVPYQSLIKGYISQGLFNFYECIR